MKIIPAHLQGQYNGEVTTLCTLWKITRTDGTIFGFTDANIDVTYSGLTYEAMTGYTASQMQLTDQLNVDNLQLQGLLESPSITPADLSAGLWDYAAVQIYRTDYYDPAGGVEYLMTGNLGQVVANRNSFQAEIRGLMQPLQNESGQLISPACRAELGDTRCKVDLTPFTFAATITAVTNSATFNATALTQVDDYFSNGVITWTSGNNNALKMEVKHNTQSSSQVVLQLGMPYIIQVGDTFNIVAGCDKLQFTCINKFNNIVNFRGEPFLPGNDFLTKGIPSG